MISQGAVMNMAANDGGTALHNAAKNGDLDDTKHLLSQGAEVNKGMKDGHTALDLAALMGHLEVTKYLINQGAEINVGDENGWTALHSAAQGGHIDVVKYLISQGAEVNKGRNDGRTALDFAACKGHLEVAKYLISQGAEVNKGDEDGWTALHSAAQEGHIEVVKYLISQGAEVNMGAQHGLTALHIASFHGHLGVTEYVIGEGAVVNKGDDSGFSSLHVAARKGHLDVTICLVRHGADMEKGDDDGRTPLYYAVQNGHHEVVRMLLSRGAHGDIEDIHKQTPLQLALALGHKKIADLFTDCSVSKPDEDELTDIHHAIQQGHTSVIERLVDKGADLNVQSPDGQTCLHMAIKLCYKTDRKVQETEALTKISDEFYKGELCSAKALVFYLLENGAKSDVRNKSGKLPIEYAKDEVVRQMILSRLPSFDMIQSYREDELSTSTTISVQVVNGQEIELEDHGVSMSIPPQALSLTDSGKVSLSLVRELHNVEVGYDESVACYGIRCDPPDTVFHKPVKINIPHSASIMNPQEVTPDIVCRGWDTQNGLPTFSRRRSSTSPEQPPYCRINKTHLDLYIDYCAEWWVLIPVEQQVVQRKLLCTPYIPDAIEQGKETEIHLYIHADIPGLDMEIQEDEKQVSYREAHRSIPFSVLSTTDDIKVTCDQDGLIVQEEMLSLKDIQSRIRHSMFLSVTLNEDDCLFGIMVKQVEKHGVCLSIAFVIRCTDDLQRQDLKEPSTFFQAIEEVPQSDLSDLDISRIAEELSVDQYYDLGVALGFRIQQLDVIEYRRLRNREQAFYDMLVRWRQTHAPSHNAKQMLLSIMESVTTVEEQIKITDPTTGGEIPDKTLVALARQIKAERFFEVGEKLGFSKTELKHMEHRTLSNRKDANIQMLSKWKASQTSGSKAAQTLKKVWESVKSVPVADSIGDDGNQDRLESSSKSADEHRPKPPKSSSTSKPEDMEIITASESKYASVTGVAHTEFPQDIDRCGGTPSGEELLKVALAVNRLSLAWELGKSLPLNNDIIVGFIDPPDSTALNRITWQLLDRWWNSLEKEGRENHLANLLQEYNIQDVDAGRQEICKKICSKSDLLKLCQHLNLEASAILQAMCAIQSYPDNLTRRCVLQMLLKWAHDGGTRERLLEVAQAFRFNDAADHIATTIRDDPGLKNVFSHGIIDHKGGELQLDELGIKISIPPGAIPIGMRSVVTIRVPRKGTFVLPLQEGEVLVTPVIKCSLGQELLKPATVVLPHCISCKQCEVDLSVTLYTRIRPGTFGRRKLTPHTSEDFSISKNMVEFRVHHLQIWALSSTDLERVLFQCIAFQPLVMPPSLKPTLRVHISHPYKNYEKDIKKAEEGLPVPHNPVMKALNFSVISKTGDLKVCCSDISKRDEMSLQHHKGRIVPLRHLLTGESSALTFDLQFSQEERGQKALCIILHQGTSILAEEKLTTSVEEEPDYGLDHTDMQGRLQVASDKLVETVVNVIQTPKDVQSLGYKLGFSYSAVEKYLKREDASFDSVSRSGFGEMLRDWRRQVRPSEQVYELHVALQNSGLNHTAVFFLHEYLQDPTHGIQEEPGKPLEDTGVHPLTKDESEGVFDQRGGELTIPSHGLTLSIPPGALPEGIGQRISVQILSNIPPEITWKDDEMIVTHGFQCLPSGLHFAPDKPVRLTIPHCANLFDPKKVQVVLYSWNHEGRTDGKPERTVLTSKTCRVTLHHVEISLKHFTNRIVAFIKDIFHISGKRMSFMPFLPRRMPSSRHMLLEFRMVNKPHGTIWRDVHDVRKEANYQPTKDDDDEMNVKDEDLKVTYQLHDSDTLEKIVRADLLNNTKHTVYFAMDFTGKANDLLVQLKVIQSILDMDIQFRTQFLASNGERFDASSSSQDSVTENKLEILSSHIPHEKYTTLCAELGMEYNEAQSILASCNGNYRGAFRHCLGQWKDRTCGKVDDIAEILKQVHLENLIKYIK